MESVLTGDTVAIIVTASVKKMTTCSPIIGHLLHLTIRTSSEKNVFHQKDENYWQLPLATLIAGADFKSLCFRCKKAINLFADLASG